MTAIIYSCTGRTVAVLSGNDRKDLEDSAVAICDSEDGEGFYYYEIR